MIHAESQYLWTVDSWASQPGMGLCAFSLRLSPAFLKAAKLTQYDPERLQIQARHLVDLSGLGVPMAHETFFHFGEYGVHNIAVPGNATGLDWHLPYGDIGGAVEEEGVELAPHNIDSPLQQSVLMALWMIWAPAVEAQAWEREREVTA
jgi:hypothetical protein